MSAARPATRAAFGRALAVWHAKHRRELSIRRTTDPWAILVAEVMSQQTQIGRIGHAWERFLAHWPEPAALAAAGTRDLLRAWAGLGYNRRALALREAARTIVRDHGGRVPHGIEALERLPGVGPYTARAVAASAFGAPVAPLDVNVRRVVGRVVGPMPARDLQAAASDLVSRRDPRGWLDAVMDLAASVCTPRTPRCPACPLRRMCVAHATGAGAIAAGAIAAGAIGAGAIAAPRRRPAARFSSTNRWLRGRLLAAVREAPAGTWVAAPDGVGEHDGRSVTEALRALERDGFVDLLDGQVRVREAQAQATNATDA